MHWGRSGILLLAWILGAGLLAAEEPGLRDTVRKANEDRAAKIRTLRLEWTTTTRISEFLVRRQERDNRGAPFLLVQADPQKAREELDRRSSPIVWKEGFTEFETSTTLLVADRTMRSETIGLVPEDTKRLTAKHRIALVDETTETLAEIQAAGIPWPQIRIQPAQAPNASAVQGPSGLPSFLIIDRGPLPWLGPLGGIPVSQHLDPRREGVEAEERTISGRSYVVLRENHPGKVVKEETYDPNQGYTLTEESITHSGHLRARLECRYRRDDSLAVWLPTGWTRTQYIDDAPHRVETATVRKCEVNPEFDDRTFDIAFPAGSVVIDERPEAEGFDPQNKGAVYLLRFDGVKRLIPFADRARRYDVLLKETR